MFPPPFFDTCSPYSGPSSNVNFRRSLVVEEVRENIFA
jgi:hypothetical protein